MGTESGADDVVGVLHAGDPVAHGFIDGFLEGGLSGSDSTDFRTHEPHPGDVERLPFHIDFPHIDHALHPEAGTDRGGGDSMLPSAGFRDDAGFP